MSYVVFAWIASVLFAVEGIIGKLTSKYSINNPWLFAFAWNLIVLLFTLVIVLSQKVAFPTSWGNIFLVGLFYALGSIFYTLSLYALDVSVLAPMFNFRTIFSVILGVFLLGQSLALFQYALIGVIVIAGFFVSLDEHMKIKSFFNPSTFIVLMCMLTIALEGIFTNKALRTDSLWTVTLWYQVVGQTILLATIPKFWRDVKTINLSKIGTLSVMSIAGTAGLVAANISYMGNVGIASTIISLPVSMVMAFIFAVFAPKLLERHPMKIYAIRFAAAAVMFLAAIKLTP